MTRVIPHSSQTLDDLGDARQRPQVGVETMRPRALSQRFVYLPKLGRLQPRLAASASRAAQSNRSTALPLAIPTRHTLTTHFQFSGDGCKDQFPGSKQAGRLFATTRKTQEIPAWRYRHTDSIGKNRSVVTILCESVTVLCEVL